MKLEQIFKYIKYRLLRQILLLRSLCVFHSATPNKRERSISLVTDNEYRELGNNDYDVKDRSVKDQGKYGAWGIESTSTLIPAVWIQASLTSLSDLDSSMKHMLLWIYPSFFFFFFFGFKVQVLVAQFCLALCDHLDCSLPGSSVRGILQERILK